MQSIIDFLWSIFEYIIFWQVIPEYEGGVLLRYGEFKKDLGPGLHFFIPLGVDVILTDGIVITTDHMYPQTLDTFDSQTITLTPVVTWKIFDLRLALLGVEDYNGVLVDKVCTHIAEQVVVTEYNEIFVPKFWHDIAIKSRRDVKKHGIYIESVKFTDLAKIKTIRIIQE